MPRASGWCGDLGTTLSEIRSTRSLGECGSACDCSSGSILARYWGIAGFSAVRQYKFFDRSFGVFSFILLSTPVFLLAICSNSGQSLNSRLGTTFLYGRRIHTELSGGTWNYSSIDQHHFADVVGHPGGVAFIRAISAMRCSMF